MSDKIREWKEKRIRVTCSRCGKKYTMRQDAAHDNMRNHNGEIICIKCNLKNYRVSDDRKELIDYIYSFREEKLRAKLRKKHIVLLNHPKNKEGLFPYMKDTSLILDVQCTKCGFRWNDSPLNLYSSSSGCPICDRVKELTKVKERVIERLRKKNIEFVNNDFNGEQETPKKYLFKCTKCGYEWRSRVHDVLYKCPMCPNCRKKIKMENKKVDE